MARRRPVGFTLVELLVVIGIIALLISILLPTLNKARAAAATVQCGSNMRQIAQAIFLYTTDSKGIMPPSQVLGTSTIYPSGWYWANELVRLKYISSKDAFLPGGAGTTDISVNTVFFCKSANADVDTALLPGLKLTNAAYPTDPQNGLASINDTGGRPVIPNWYQLNAKQAASTTRLGGINSKATPFAGFFGTTIDANLKDAGFTRKFTYVRKGSQVPMVLEGAEGRNFAPKYIAGRHGSKSNNGKDAMTNIAFFDGHVSQVSTEAWFKQADFTPVQNDIAIYLRDQQ